MATFTGTTGNDVANSAGGILTGFTGGTLAALQNASGDVFYGLAGNDTILAGAGGDFIEGQTGDDTLFGGFGADEIRGGAGADEIDGGADFDTIYLDTSPAGVIVRLEPGRGWGGDAEGDSYENVEAVVGSNFDDAIYGDNQSNALEGNNGDDQLFGGPGGDFLFGGLGNDRLDGGPGIDNMIGEFGDDIYIVENEADSAIEDPNEGLDIVFSYIDFTLGPNVEILVLRSSASSGTGNSGFNRLFGGANADTLSGLAGNDMLFGGGANDTLYGGADDDRLDGGPGNDAMYGGTGNDIFIVAQPGDTVIENAGQGTDTIYSYLGIALPANVENLILRGTARVGSGNGEANSIAGTSGNDVLTGLGGNDKLFGKSGNDTLFGGPGNDRLYGDRGKDEMSGGAGQDQFIFRDIADSSHQNAFADLITDFSQADFDKLVFTDIDADTTNAAATNDAFTFIGSDPFSAPGQLRYEQLPSNTAVTGDVNGDGVADFLIILTGLFTLTSGDFFL
ncbi:MAG: calcium-binding protein [Sphingomonadaceae bacterium]